MIYFTSDTHFGSLRTLQFSKRPFLNTAEMDFTIIANWNKLITKDDIVYHLGDFGDYSLRSYLNSNIILICGNYEYNDFSKGLTVKDLENYGFNEVSLADNYPLKKEQFIEYVNDEYKDIVPNCLYLTHEPEKCIKDYYDDVYEQLLPLDISNIFNLFGHIHKLQMVRKYGLNVGVDCHNFKPISINDVLFYYNAIRNHYDKNVFE